MNKPFPAQKYRDAAIRIKKYKNHETWHLVCEVVESTTLSPGFYKFVIRVVQQENDHDLFGRPTFDIITHKVVKADIAIQGYKPQAPNYLQLRKEGYAKPTFYEILPLQLHKSRCWGVSKKFQYAFKGEAGGPRNKIKTVKIGQFQDEPVTGFKVKGIKPRNMKAMNAACKLRGEPAIKGQLYNHTIAKCELGDPACELVYLRGLGGNSVVLKDDKVYVVNGYEKILTPRYKELTQALHESNPMGLDWDTSDTPEQRRKKAAVYEAKRRKIDLEYDRAPVRLWIGQEVTGKQLEKFHKVSPVK